MNLVLGIHFQRHRCCSLLIYSLFLFFFRSSFCVLFIYQDQPTQLLSSFALFYIPTFPGSIFVSLSLFSPLFSISRIDISTAENYTDIRFPSHLIEIRFGFIILIAFRFGRYLLQLLLSLSHRSLVAFEAIFFLYSRDLLLLQLVAKFLGTCRCCVTYLFLNFVCTSRKSKDAEIYLQYLCMYVKYLLFITLATQKHIE